MKETDKSVDTGAKFPYLDILYLEHPEPKNHKRMSREARAGQFSPFAALTGYDEQVKETARLTSKKIDLDDEKKEHIERFSNAFGFDKDKLSRIMVFHLKEEKEITVTYFIPDLKKSGGRYQDKTGIVRKIDLYNNKLIFKDKTKINIEDIVNINIDNLEKTYF